MKERNIFTEQQIGAVKINLANGYSYNLRTKEYQTEDCSICLKKDRCVPYNNRDTVLECADFTPDETIRLCSNCRMMTDLNLDMRCRHCGCLQIADMDAWMRARRVILDYARTQRRWDKEIERIQDASTPRR